MRARSLSPELLGHSAAAKVTSIQKVATVQFDPEGDVIFVLPCSEGTARFQINSSIVCLQSPVFRAMMGRNSRFKEATDLANRDAIGPPLEISLADDDPKALGVILRVMHLQHDWVPVSLSEDRLYQVAILCDKYDMRQALKTYLDKWLLYLGVVVEAPNEADKWLFMAYAFALPTLFTSCSKKLIMDTCIRVSGGLDAPCISKGFAKASLNEYIPSAVVSCVLAARQQAIEELVDCAHRYIDKYNDPSKTVCVHKENLCDSTTFGYLTRAFKSIGVYPEASGLMNMSLGHIKKLIDGVLTVGLSELYFGKLELAGCCALPQLMSCDRCTIILLSSGICPKCNIMYTPRCVICGKLYKAGVINFDHSSCIPLAVIRVGMDRIVNRITGLQYSDFVRNNTQNEQALTTRRSSGAEDLWESLVFQ
ncbi:hypothetical protein EV426DRAFT_592602 [Tirmania nivea]|nr:hypothetical protein EV426DRAFT_592602 [Tirmania nivea]